MPATTMTAGDLRRALTTALAGAKLENLDDVLRATTTLPPDAVAGALLEGGRAARQISARRCAPTLRAELDTVTLTALIAAAERAAESAGHEFTDEKLDEDVHDAASERGATVNNGGVEAQVRYLAEQLGVNHVSVLLQSLGVTIGGDIASTTADAERSIDDPPPDSLEALRRLIREHPDRVEDYDVVDVDEIAINDTPRASGLEEGALVEIPEPTEHSVAGRAPEHRQYVPVTRGRLAAPITITGTDGAEKIVVSDSAGETRWLYVTDVRLAAAPSP